MTRILRHGIADTGLNLGPMVHTRQFLHACGWLLGACLSHPWTTCPIRLDIRLVPLDTRLIPLDTPVIPLTVRLTAVSIPLPTLDTSLAADLIRVKPPLDPMMAAGNLVLPMRVRVQPLPARATLAYARTIPTRDPVSPLAIVPIRMPKNLRRVSKVGRGLDIGIGGLDTRITRTAKCFARPFDGIKGMSDGIDQTAAGVRQASKWVVRLTNGIARTMAAARRTAIGITRTAT